MPSCKSRTPKVDIDGANINCGRDGRGSSVRGRLSVATGIHGLYSMVKLNDYRVNNVGILELEFGFSLIFLLSL